MLVIRKVTYPHFLLNEMASEVLYNVGMFTKCEKTDLIEVGSLGFLSYMRYLFDGNLKTKQISNTKGKKGGREEGRKGGRRMKKGKKEKKKEDE
jgi:hypothetical protein